jgi:hypothetical protein
MMRLPFFGAIKAKWFTTFASHIIAALRFVDTLFTVGADFIIQEVNKIHRILG